MRKKRISKMPLDTISGGSEFVALDKGRQPQFAGNIVEFDITENIVCIMGQTVSNLLEVAITPQHKAFAATVTVYNINTANSVTSTLQLLLNNSVLAQWALPAIWTPTNVWRITDIVPIIKEFWGASNTMGIRIIKPSAFDGNSLASATIKLLCIPI